MSFKFELNLEVRRWAIGFGIAFGGIQDSDYKYTQFGIMLGPLLLNFGF